MREDRPRSPSGDRMASRRQAGEEAVLMRSAKLVSEAMDLLDGHAVAPEAAAYLALAQQQLREQLTPAVARAAAQKNLQR